MDSSLPSDVALSLFHDQLRSRELDIAARRLKEQDRGFYTISSAGHEQNAVLGELLDLGDPCLLHYRSGALMLARARKHGSVNAVRDTLLSLCASREDPIAEGRHKVWGSRPLWVPPQTSTIASHLPRAVGMAFSIGRAARLGLPLACPASAIVCCSFGDASANHASAQTAFNAARFSHRQGNAMPILFVCEDNGLGISVPTPRGWIEACFGSSSHLEYVRAEGDLGAVYAACRSAIERCRAGRTPVFLHLPTVRLFGHAGSDVEAAYRPGEAIEADLARDPLLENADWLVATGRAQARDLLELLDRVEREVAEQAEAAALRPKLDSRRAVMAPLEYPARDRPEAPCRRIAASPAARREAFGGALPEETTTPSRRTLAAHIGAALRDEMLERPEIWVFGEDVARKGGVYHVTRDLARDLGGGRVFDTILDETSILGVALGAGQLGLLPVPEIQYLAYVHNALDQLRGEACSQAFFSSGQFLNPMVVRIASFAYQRGFGGHFHNDNSIGALRDIPGLWLACPSRGDDAARMLRAALEIAASTGRVVCFLEPIALYHEKDLLEPGDQQWLTDYPAPGSPPLLPGEPRLYGDAGDLTIVTYANGVRLALRAAARLAADEGIEARVLDLRWLAPLAVEPVLEAARASGRVLVVDECRQSGGIADTLVAELVRRDFPGDRLASIASADSYVPLGPAAATVLVGEEDIADAALALIRR